MGLLALHKHIANELACGKSRSALFTTLSSSAPSEALKFAYCIASVPQESLRKKYLFANGGLVLCLLGYGLSTLLAELPIDFQQPTIFIGLKIIIPFIFSYFIFIFHGGIYRLLLLWLGLDLVETLIFAKYTTAFGLARLLFLVVTLLLCAIIAKKVFPHMGIVGPKKGKDNAYLL